MSNLSMKGTPHSPPVKWRGRQHVCRRYDECTAFSMYVVTSCVLSVTSKSNADGGSCKLWLHHHVCRAHTRFGTRVSCVCAMHKLVANGVVYADWTVKLVVCRQGVTLLLPESMFVPYLSPESGKSRSWLPATSMTGAWVARTSNWSMNTSHIVSSPLQSCGARLSQQAWVGCHADGTTKTGW